MAPFSLNVQLENKGLQWSPSASAPVLLELGILKSRVGAVAPRKACAAVVDKRAVDDLEFHTVGDLAADARVARDFPAADASGCPFEHYADALSAGGFRACELEDAVAHSDVYPGVPADFSVLRCCVSDPTFIFR
jgi:hypothetical protein